MTTRCRRCLRAQRTEMEGQVSWNTIDKDGTPDRGTQRLNPDCEGSMQNGSQGEGNPMACPGNKLCTSNLFCLSFAWRMPLQSEAKPRQNISLSSWDWHLCFVVFISLIDWVVAIGEVEATERGLCGCPKLWTLSRGQKIRTGGTFWAQEGKTLPRTETQEWNAGNQGPWPQPPVQASHRAWSLRSWGCGQSWARNFQPWTVGSKLEGTTKVKVRGSTVKTRVPFTKALFALGAASPCPVIISRWGRQEYSRREQKVPAEGGS